MSQPISICERAVPGVSWLLASLLVFTLAGCMQTQPGAVYFNQTHLHARVVNADSAEQPPIGVRFQDPRSILKYVLSQAPRNPVVYPTEQYYYYRFILGSRVVSGNIRFVDAQTGGISVGYFDAVNADDMQTAEFSDGQPGISIRCHAADHSIMISVDECTRTFHLDQEAFSPPSFPLLEGEELISGVRDESGYFLYLIYWKPGRDFYYILNPDKPLPEKLHLTNDTSLVWFGENSRFCFVSHAPTGRRILVGVHRREIELNTWYDGPFDQVPPNLQIGGILNAAYPYVQDAGGVDEHGNFLTQPGQRVAISPYQQYASGPALVDLLAVILKPQDPTPLAWTSATYEYKKDWRMPPGWKEQPHGTSADPPVHNLSRSSQWPSNHWGNTSREWPPAHQKEISAGWPANHVFEQSHSLKRVHPREDPVQNPKR